MNPVVRFDRVSKRYRLGLTRTSLPTLLADAVRNRVRPASRRDSRKQVLWALRDVSFELNRGESMALIGPNGAGKSTLLKLLSKITRPTDGTIEVGGRLSALIELGSGFHPDLTGRENIYLNGAILGLSREAIGRRFDEIVAFSGLEDFLDTPLKRYSSGMEVRLGFSVAAFIEPEILLVDEVLAVGDALFRERSLQCIRSLADKGTSIIFVSHNLYMVQAVCGKGIYLQHGEIRCMGDVSTVIDAYERDIHLARAAKLRHDDTGLEPGVGDDATSVEVTKVTVRSATNPSREVLDARQPAVVEIHYHVRRVPTPVNLVVYLVRSDGVLCCMIRSKVDKFTVELKPGSGMVLVEIDPLQLLTGTYFAEVVLTDESDSIRLGVNPARSDWFTVKGRISNPGLGAGVFEPFARWRTPQALPDGECIEAVCRSR
jgi:lipopolysaccharide transport system ATP-binding protein